MAGGKWRGKSRKWIFSSCRCGGCNGSSNHSIVVIVGDHDTHAVIGSHGLRGWCIIIGHIRVYVRGWMKSNIFINEGRSMKLGLDGHIFVSTTISSISTRIRVIRR